MKHLNIEVVENGFIVKTNYDRRDSETKQHVFTNENSLGKFVTEWGKENKAPEPVKAPDAPSAVVDYNLKA